jgi:DNA-binding response OmpR family regulator
MATKILVIDDEEAIRDALGRKLRREGFNVSLAGNGLEGLRAFHAERPDLVIVDIVMPEMNGLTVAQRIREIAETPIMMLSAQAITEDDRVKRGS